jgi:hypothetical protein
VKVVLGQGRLGGCIRAKLHEPGINPDDHTVQILMYIAPPNGAAHRACQIDARTERDPGWFSRLVHVVAANNRVLSSSHFMMYPARNETDAERLCQELVTQN